MKSLLNELVQRVSYRMSVLYPQSRMKIKLETRKIIIKRVFLSVALLAFLLFFSMDFYWILLCTMFVFMVNVAYEASVYNKLHFKILEQFEEFINELVFQYRYSKSLEESLFETISSAPYEIGLHGNLIFSLLDNDDYDDALEYYKSISPNSFFLMFYSLCHMVKIEGDKQIEGESLFIKNLNLLADDISEEMNLQKKTTNAFTGLLFVSILPVFFIKPMEIWAMSNVDGLRGYYHGVAGILGTLIVMGLSMGAFLMIKKMEYPFVQKTKKSRLIELLTYGKGDDGWYAKLIENIQGYFINRNYGKYKRLSVLLSQVYYELNVREFKVKQVLYFFAGALIGIYFSSRLCVGHFLVVIIGGILGIIAYEIPLLEIGFSRNSIRNNISNEIIRIQSIIQMCINQDGVDVSFLLSHMEMVSMYFKGVLAKAFDAYDGNGLEALEELKVEAGEKSFGRVVEGLIACDVLPVYEAFANLNRERYANIQKKRIVEDKILQDRAAIAKFIAYIPLMTSILIKLILPFVMEGMNSMLTFTTEFQV